MLAIRMIRTFCMLFLVGLVPGFSQTPINLLGTAETAKLGNTEPQKPQRVPSYVLGPDDLITVFVLEAEEFAKNPTRIDASGSVNLPLIGRVQAANLTIEQFETELRQRLSKYIRDPQVTVSVSEFHSQPVSVLGMVNTPGVQQLQGRKTFVEVLSMAGGVRSEAAPVANITRRIEYGRIPLPGAQDDPTGQFSMAELSLRDVLTAVKPEENILIQPFDVITIPKGSVVYVIGEVKRTGRIVLVDYKTISVITALAMAEGLTPLAKKKGTKILRPVPGLEQRTEIVLDLDKIFAGKSPDVILYPEDILMVPLSGAKAAKDKLTQAGINLATSMVYHTMYY